MALAVELVGSPTITSTPGVTGSGTGSTASRTITATDSPEIALLGAVTETAPATDTASSGLNGRLQRVAQRLSTLITNIGTLVFGAGTAASALRITLASDAPGVADSIAGEYETVAASASTQALGASGAPGDYLEAVLLVPATTSPGAVSIKDGSNGAITIFTGGTDSVNNLAPIYVPLAIKSVQGAWQITTGSNISAIGIGNFT